MIVEDQLDRGAGRIGGIEKLEEFDELAAAVAIPDERVDLAGEQIDPGQQAERAMAFVNYGCGLPAQPKGRRSLKRQILEKAVPLPMRSFTLPASSAARPRCLSRDLVAFSLFCRSNRHRVRNFGV